MLKKDVPDGKIVESLLTTQPLEMLPGFSVPNPGIVFLTAGCKTACNNDPPLAGIGIQN
jgi:hypothetical protein